MLIINDKKDSYGYFSKLGIKSIKENVLLLRNEKKKVLEKSKSSSTSNIFNNSKNKKNLESHYKKDGFGIFTVEEQDKENIEEIANEIIKEKVLNIIKRNSKNKTRDNKNNTKSSNIFMNKTLNLKSKNFYHKNKIKKKRKKLLVPPCTKYNPKYESILPRSASTPLWKSITGRKEKKREVYDSPFYLKHELIQDNMAGKIFIDFSKQPPRKCFFENNKENNLNNSMISNERPNTCRNKILNGFNKLSYQKKNNKNSKNNLNETNSSNDSYERFKSAYKRKIIKGKNEYKNKKEKKNDENIKKIKSIDFNQIISREALDELENNKMAIVPYLFPNYKSIRERPVMMVVYNKKKHKVNKNKSQLCKYEHIFSNIKNNSHVISPNFDLMTSRPYDEKDSLPSYMKKIFDRNSYYKITGSSLKLNNYSNRDFIMNRSSFWPKNSFNKFINLDFLKSKKNIYEILLNNKYGDKNQLLEKSLSFYAKNYNDLITKDNIFKMKNFLNKCEDKNHTKSIKQLIKEIKKN